MSQQLIDLSPDLKRLRDEGYLVEVRSGYLVLRDIPYVNSQREIKRGALVSDLTLVGNRTARPADHVVRFAGEYPCNSDGVEIVQIVNGDVAQVVDESLTTQYVFSSKPAEGYNDYYEKMTTYAAILSHPARAIDPQVTAQTYRVIETDEDDSPFNYIDTASSRADIVAATKKLKLSKVAIVGVGGTGSYILDLVAKTPVKEIHIFDGDTFLQHNAFRAPGSPSIAELQEAPTKVTYLQGRYSKMHRGIVAHAYSLDVSNAGELEGADFVFLSMDGGPYKGQVIKKLEALNIPFVDTGMGIQMVDDSLIGLVRLTTSTAQRREHVHNRVGFNDDDDNEYSRNIQIADLNALNAALAVIKWKKIFGFYKDHEGEHHSAYDLDGNVLHNEETA